METPESRLQSTIIPILVAAMFTDLMLEIALDEFFNSTRRILYTASLARRDVRSNAIAMPSAKCWRGLAAHRRL
jgi:hypothetical protein